MTPASKNASIIKSTANRLGFDFCGIAKAGFMEEETPKILIKGMKELIPILG